MNENLVSNVLTIRKTPRRTEFGDKDNNLTVNTVLQKLSYFAI